MSIYLRTVQIFLEVVEHFTGFFETAQTDAETLMNILKDVLCRYNLPTAKCLGGPVKNNVYEKRSDWFQSG